MAEFNIKSDAVDVEQIMQRVRNRIREKRGVDYTEEEVRELASVKLEKFLDPRLVRSDLIEHFRKGRAAAPTLPPPPGNYAFDDDTMYASSRSAAGRMISGVRRLLNPLLKLFFNPNPVITVLHLQSEINDYQAKVNDKWIVREQLDFLNYEVMSNLVLELTRASIEVKNLKMRVESLSSRLDFDERRARALEGAVQYKEPVRTTAGAAPNAAGDTERDQVSSEARARRRRRRRRRPSGPAGTGEPSSSEAASESGPRAETDGSTHSRADAAPAADNQDQ